jgi:hypothetical protein
MDLLGNAASASGVSTAVLARSVLAYGKAVADRCERDRDLRPELKPSAGGRLPVVTSGRLDHAGELLRDLARHGGPAGASAQLLLVEVLLADWRLRARPGTLQEALNTARRAITGAQDTARKSEDGADGLAEAHLALARVLAACPPGQTESDSPEPAAAAFRAACDGFAGSDASRQAGAAYAWARWAMTMARWDDAAEAFGRVEAGVRAAIRADTRREDRLRHLRSMTGVATDAAFARALAGHPEAAIEELETDRNMFHAVTLSEEVPAGAPQAGAAGPFIRAGRAHATELGIGLRELRARFPDTALAFLVPSSVGGVALIAVPGEPVQVEVLPELSSAAVELHFGQYWGALLSRQGRLASEMTVVFGADGIEALTPQAQLDALTGWLWTAAMRRVIQLAGSRSPIALIPAGMLVTAPLHAAWRPDPTAVTGRRYALDDALLTYLPTAGMVRPSPPAPLGERSRVLLVRDPLPCSERELPGSAAEAAAVARAFPDVTSLAHGDATRKRVLAALPEYEIAHLICHGRSDLVRPLDSHLVLSNDEHLSVDDLIDRDLSALRLTVLSACESASSSTHLPEAAISLPAALIAGGAGGVVGSLWEASDADSALLMAALFRGLRPSGTTPRLPSEPAQALRAAQQWMRDTTNTEKAQDFPDLVDTTSDRGGPRLAALWSAARTASLNWAGFVYAGR